MTISTAAYAADRRSLARNYPERQAHLAPWDQPRVAAAAAVMRTLEQHCAKDTLQQTHIVAKAQVKSVKTYVEDSGFGSDCREWLELIDEADTVQKAIEACQYIAQSMDGWGW